MKHIGILIDLKTTTFSSANAAAVSEHLSEIIQSQEHLHQGSPN